MYIRRTASIIAAVSLGALSCSWLLPRAAAQDDPDSAVEEVAVNEAAGRVVIAVVKNAVLICTAEDSIEPGTRLPTPVQLSSVQAGTLLGAVDWVSPSLQKTLGRLDLDLPHLRADAGGLTPHLAGGAENTEASDIEAIGKPVRQRLAELAGDIHSNLNWPSGEPVLQLVIADYLDGYGPEVWQLTYTLSQEQQKGDYWVTNIDDPVYLQIWPPEKGQGHTLMEFDYPAKNATPTLLELLRKKDPRLDGMFHSDPRTADTVNKFLSGDSLKIAPADATQFLRAAMSAITPPSAPQTVAIIRPEVGFDWILPPPAEPKAPKISRQNGDPNAPSLEHPPSDDSEAAPSLAHPPSH
jgi:hypothetical protein